MSLQNKVAIVTGKRTRIFNRKGGNDGIGYETVKGLAKEGAHVIIAARSQEKGEKAVERLKSELGAKANIELMIMDLSSLRSVDSFAKAFRAKNLPLHILVNNAGIMMVPFQKTVDGYESQFATNHLGHFLLTTSLLDIITKSAPARIINLTSGAHFSGHMEFDDLEKGENYNPQKGYSNSKLANVLFSFELQRRLEKSGVHNVYVHAVHPGLVRGTGLVDHFSQPFDFDGFASKIGVKVLTPPEGASCTLFVATDPSIEKDNVKAKYWNAESLKTTSPNPEANDEAIANKLWEVSEEMIKRAIGNS